MEQQDYKFRKRICMQSVARFLDGCDSKLDQIADYEAEMRAECLSEIQPNVYY